MLKAPSPNRVLGSATNICNPPLDTQPAAGNHDRFNKNYDPVRIRVTRRAAVFHHLRRLATVLPGRPANGVVQAQARRNEGMNAVGESPDCANVSDIVV